MYRSSLPVPRWFRPRSADAFRAMETKPSDVVLSSLVKGGTTWVYSVLCCLLHDIDDDGSAAKGEDAFAVIRRCQPYPDGIPLDDDEMELALSGSGEVMAHNPAMFGERCTLRDLLDQPAPRLFSTHLFGEEYLPLRLLGGGDGGGAGTGRLIVVLRNLKDTLASLHHFFGVAKDGWDGNEHGPGSLARFLDPDSPNAFGNVFSWVEAQDKVVRKLRNETEGSEGGSRVLVVYFERMKEDLPSELDRIADFLGVGPLTDAKRRAVAEACGFEAMKKAGGGGGGVGAGFSRGKTHLRSGKVGDWRNHMDEERWKRLDAVFEDRLGGVEIAQPLRDYH